MTRTEFAARAAAQAEGVVDVTRAPVALASSSPPGDTRTCAEAAALLRQAVPRMAVALHATSDRVPHPLARLRVGGPGRRLVLDGHPGSCPVMLRDGRRCRRGTADMTGGIVAPVLALAAPDLLPA
ncbi:zinc-binding metallopeptidase family protein [Roseicella aerolata]|uniref:Uncharacterized protein n=1 Tax=Roseicella aerolata TaxID=2883479 RepID=A0A9X1IFH9_9PROT|nr:hypothetical protein [Roseicella aerolata]MCB4823154.1 hypothetical protein [Roseicella aerolata]